MNKLQVAGNLIQNINDQPATIFRESRNGVRPISVAKTNVAINAFGGPCSHDTQLRFLYSFMAKIIPENQTKI